MLAARPELGLIRRIGTGPFQRLDKIRGCGYSALNSLN